jgi:hypothetical protein
MSSFGDRVRIKESPETIAAGVAGLEGDVYGFTTPSVTGIVVVGGSPDDYALNVSVESHDAELWFRPDLVEFLHHNAGSEMIVGTTKAVRQANGSWLETRIDRSSVKRTAQHAASDPRTLWERLARLFGK